MPEYAEISKKFEISSAEWAALQAFSDILKACHYVSAYVDLCSDVFQIPHVFQQILSGEKTSTLGMSLAAFEVMAAKWKKHRDAHPEFADVIDAGLDKLDEYYNYAQDVLVNTIAMGKTARKLFLHNMLTNNVTVLNPAAKLNWLCTNAPSQVEDVRQVVLTAVC